MKITVIGAGAIGGLLAGWLRRTLPPSELELRVFARGATLSALRANGLQLEDNHGGVSTLAVDATDDAGSIGPQDLVIVAVKGPALAAVAPAVAALLGPQSRVLVAMNGVPWWYFDALPGPCQGLQLESVDPGGGIRRLIPTAQVIGCVVHASALSPAPACVRHVNGRGLIVGAPSGGSDAQVDRWAAVLGGAGFDVTVSDRIQRDIWFKLWGNMTMNPVSALTGASTDRVLDDPLVRRFLCDVMLEAREIGSRFGVPIAQDPEERHAVTRKLGAFKTSMLQDWEAGRPLEIDALVGAVHEIGLHLGVPMPHTGALLGLTRLAAQSRGLY